jgi:putative ABC transport system ATP-binding protein
MMSQQNESSPVAELHEVTKRYRGGAGEVTAVDAVTLTVESGLTVLSGPSGCGKSTLINLLGALDTPTGGEVIVAGQRLSELSGAELDEYRRHTIGVVFQFFHLMPVLTVLENVALPAEFAGVPTETARRRADELLELVGLAGRAGHRPHELSGGETQRTAIARALVNRPALLLADEPTGNLDSESSRTVMDLLARAAGEQGASAIVATHDPEVVERAGRIVHLLDGRVTGSERLTKGEQA